jgi:hypothetical protein
LGTDCGTCAEMAKPGSETRNRTLNAIRMLTS